MGILRFALLAILAIAESSCIEDSSQASCVNYHLPVSTALSNIEDLCKSMPLMPGCKIRTICNDDPGIKSCSPFSILSNLCLDMPHMRACSNYSNLCNYKSVVKQCTSEGPIPSLPTSKAAKELVLDICSEMEMEGCEKCTDSKRCDSFAVYIDLCYQMPEMSQCNSYQKMCSFARYPFCQNPELGSPQMKMFFHFGYRDYVLFKSWVPTTALSYFAAVVFSFTVAMGYEYLTHFNTVVEESWSSQAVLLEHEEPLVDSTRVYQRPRRLIRAGLRMITMVVAYCCMLLAMSFNIGLFSAVILGLGVGTFIWGDRVGGQTKEHCC